MDRKKKRMSDQDEMQPLGNAMLYSMAVLNKKTSF